MPGLQEIFTPMLIINGSCTQIQKTCQKPITLVGSKYGNHSSIALWKRGGGKTKFLWLFLPGVASSWLTFDGFCSLANCPKLLLICCYKISRGDNLRCIASRWLGRIFAACCTCLWYTVFPFISGPTTPIQCSSVGVVTVSAWEIIILSPSSESPYNCPEILCIFSDYFTSDLFNFTGLSWEVLLGALHY